MFEHLTLHGAAASLVLGYRDAVVLRAWRISKTVGQPWTLAATVVRVDPYLSRQRPLLFTAPREGGFWAWPIADLQLGPDTLVAKLGPPER